MVVATEHLLPLRPQGVTGFMIMVWLESELIEYTKKTERGVR